MPEIDLKKMKKSCVGKRPRNREGAISAAERMGIPFTPYKCEFCPSWHIGKNPHGYALFYEQREIWDQVYKEVNL